MSEELTLDSIRDYLDGLVPARADEMMAMERRAKETRFPIIGPAAGYFCYQIARITQAKTIFELGSGFGYSTAWFARAVDENGGGKVHHVVWDEGLSAEARKHMQALGFSEIIDFHVGEAVETLRGAQGPFDLIFNDIDKEGYPDSLPVIKQKLKSGGVLMVDNLLRRGKIFDGDDKSASTEGVRQLTRAITADEDWIASIVPIRDGLLLAYKK